MRTSPACDLNRPIRIRVVWRLAWPMTISMLSFTAMSVADTLFVGWLGTTELAAIGIASIAAFACSAFGMGLLAEQLR
jgi:MATE family multidrug resistance protein